MDVTKVITLISGIALFLFGMKLMGDGLKSVAGSKLELILYRLSNTTLKGVLLGTGVTGVIQSSCATSVMVVGFVNSGMMKLKQAVSVILGAILGTSITGWVICLSYIDSASGWAGLISTATLTGVVALVGIILYMFVKKQQAARIGAILMGFAVLMFGMSMMSGGVGSLGGNAAFRQMLSSLSNPIIGVIVGMVATAVLQSASAAVGILQAISVTGSITIGAALPLLMGIAIGAAAPVLLSAIGATVDGKRAALIYPVTAALSVMACASVFYVLNAIFSFSFLGVVADPFVVAGVNSILRLAMVLVALPFTEIIDVMVTHMVRDKKPQGEDGAPVLEERFIGHPSLAIEQSRDAINNMARNAETALIRAFDLVGAYSEEGFAEVDRLEKLGDTFEDALGTYLIKLTGREMTDQQNRDVSMFLHTISDFERLSDHARNIAESAREIHSKGVKFSGEAQHELDVVTAAVKEIVHSAIAMFTAGDVASAYKIEPLEELIDNLCDELKLNHVERLQQGICTIDQGFVFNDLLTNCERVSDHCSNLAVAMIELESDVFDTHKYLDHVKDKHTEEFERYFDEYKERFAI